MTALRHEQLVAPRSWFDKLTKNGYFRFAMFTIWIPAYAGMTAGRRGD